MTKEVRITLVRSDGTHFALDGGTYGLISLAGFSAPPIEIFSEKSGIGNGSVITGKRVGARTLDVEARLKNGDSAAWRRQATAFANPAYTFDVYVTYDGIERFAQGCELSAFECSTENVYQPHRVKASFLCPTPYLLGVDEFGKDVAAVVGGFGFPFVSLAGYGFTYSHKAFAEQIEVYSSGDAPTPCRFVMCTSGAVVNPYIVSRGAQVKLLLEMAKDDVAIVDLATKTVTLNGQNIITQVSRISDFDGMIFQPGKNVVSYNCDSGRENISLSLYYFDRFMGV